MAFHLKDCEIFSLWTFVRLKLYLRLRCWFYSTKTESTTQREIKLVLQTFRLLGCILCVWWVYVYVGARGPLETLNIYTAVSSLLQCWGLSWKRTFEKFHNHGEGPTGWHRIHKGRMAWRHFVNVTNPPPVPYYFWVGDSISLWNWKFKLCEGLFQALFEAQ